MSSLPEINAWTSLPDAPLPRAGAAVGMVGAQLVVAGGTYWIDGTKYWADRVDAFDFEQRAWQPWPALPAPRGDTAGVVQGSRFFLIGGGTQAPAISSVVAWENGCWMERPELQLPAPRRSAAVACIGDELFVLGGLEGKGTEFHTVTSSLWSTRGSGPWRVRVPLPEPARFGCAVGVLSGRLLVVGGCTPEGTSVRNLDEILAYDPATDRWHSIGRLPMPLRGAWGVVTQESLLILGGYTTEFRREILAVDANGQTRLAGLLPVALADARFACHGDQIYGVTGEDGVKRRFPGFIAATLPISRKPSLTLP